MKYEARLDTGVAVSIPTGAATNGHDLVTAQDYCQANGSGYDIISNNHWIAIAREIERNKDNWSSGTRYVGELSRGFSASTGSGDPWTNGAGNFATNSNDGCEYNTSNGACGSTGNFTYKRTHLLASGEAIWDFAGNHMEWIDWTEGGAANRWTPTCSDAGYSAIEVKDFSCGSIDDSEVLSYAAEFSQANLTSSEGLGIIYLPQNVSRGAAVRGGHKNDGANAGIYALVLNMFEASSTDIGFRCIYNFQ